MKNKEELILKEICLKYGLRAYIRYKRGLNYVKKNS